MNTQQLRNSILQQAIQGKLVPQDPNDEPASVLLDRIRKEKEQLVKEGKLKKKDLVTTPIAEEDMPENIVNGWAYFYIKDVFFTTSGGTPLKGHPEYYDGNIPWVRSGELNTQYLYGAELSITEAGLNSSSAKFFPIDTVVIAMYGATIGKTSIFKMPMTTNQAICGIFPVNGILPEYIYYFLQSKKQDYCSIAFGGAQPNISQDKIKNTIFPLPPLAEQRRIVAKLEELLPLVEQYGKAQDDLDALNNDLPRRLRQSILQQAIQGKLVPQDPNDEPASVLLEKAFSVKKKMISEKIVKADKLDTPVSEDEFVFELPNGWSWVRLNNVHIIARGGSPRPIKEYLTNAEDGVNWIKIGDTEKGGKYINSTQEKIKPSGVCHSRMIHKGDFLLTNSMSFGRPYISNVEGCIHDGWLVISPAYGTVFDQDYLYYLLSSPFTFDQFLGKVAGAVVQNLNSDKVATSVFPLPPLAEQKRIVAKIEQLFTEIDKLVK